MLGHKNPNINLERYSRYIKSNHEKNSHFYIVKIITLHNSSKRYFRMPKLSVYTII